MPSRTPLFGANDAVDNPPKVLFLDHCAEMSGGEIALKRLLSVLRSRSTVVLGEDGPLAGELVAVGVDVRVLPLGAASRDVGRLSRGLAAPAIWGTVRYAFVVAGIARQESFDLIHTNSMKAHVYGGLAGLLARKPVVWHVRDRIARDYLSSPLVLLMRVLAFLLPSALVCNSRATLELCGGPLKRREVVYDCAPSPETRAEASIRDEVGTVGMVGRVSRWKGQDLFLREAARAFPEDVRFVIVGSPMFGEDDYLDELEALSLELSIVDRVEFRGFRGDVEKEMLSMDIVVHCSRIPEPFGQVVVEAMALGLPVVASRYGGPSEIIEDGVSGILFDPLRPGDLCDSLRQVERREVRNRIAIEARARAAEFSPTATADGVARVHRSVLS